ncbi:hypothetical protein Tco_1372456, partial [Tanacetum coccineum]
MVTDLEDSKTHTVGGVWSGEYMDHVFTKSMSELDRCYTMLQELRSTIVGGGNHLNREGNKRGIHRSRTNIEGFYDNHGRNKPPKQVWRHNDIMSSDEDEGEETKDRVPTTKIFRSKILINNSVCSLDIDGCSMNNLVSRKLVDFLKLPMEICPIEGYQVCRVPVSIGKSYKVEYDVKQNLYLFSWVGRNIAIVLPKETPQLPKPEVKVEEKIVKVEVVDEHVKKIQYLQTYKEHDEKNSTLLFGTRNTVDTLKTCEEIMGSNDDEDLKGFNCELKPDFKCVHNINVRDLDHGLILRMIIKNQVKFSMENREAIFITIENLGVADKVHTTRCFRSWIDSRVYSTLPFCVSWYQSQVHHEVLEVDEALDIENWRASSFQVKGIHVDETK